MCRVRGLLFPFLRENTVNNFFGATVVKIVVRERRARLSSGLLVFLGRKTYRLPYMSNKKPQTYDDFLDIHGVGIKKADSFATLFLKTIQTNS